MKKIILLVLPLFFISYWYTRYYCNNLCREDAQTLRSQWHYYLDWDNDWEACERSPTCYNSNSSYSTYQAPTDRDAVCAKKYKWTHYRASDAMCVCPNGKPQDSKTQSCDSPKVEVKKETKPKIDMTYYETDKSKHCELNRPGTVYFEDKDFCWCANWKQYTNSCKSTQLLDAVSFSDESIDWKRTNNNPHKPIIKKKKWWSKECITPTSKKIIKSWQKVKWIFELYNKDEKNCWEFLAIMKCNDWNFEITNNKLYWKCSESINDKKLACELPRWWLIEDGEKIKTYKNYIEKFQCDSEYRTCKNWKLEWDVSYKYKQCVIDENLLES